MRPNYRASSYGTDIEDEVMDEYELQSGAERIIVKQYHLEEENNNRWTGEFSYQNVHYLLIGMDIEKEEFEKILINLHFS